MNDFKTPEKKLARDRQWKRTFRARIKREIFTLLGDECAACGSKEELTIDHINSITWHRYISSERRWKKYLEEAKEGKIQLLCNVCNAMKG